MKLHIIHGVSDELEDQLADIQHSLYIINERLNQMGAAQDEIVVLLGKFNDATNAIAAEIQTLIAGNGGATKEQLDTAFQPVIDKLNALGTTPP